MKNLIFTLVILFSASICLGQTEVVDTVSKQLRDSSVPNQLKGDYFIKLADFVQSNDTVIAMFSTEFQEVRVWTYDQITFYGIIINKANKIRTLRKNVTYYYVFIDTLDNEQAEKIYSIIEKSKIVEEFEEDTIYENFLIGVLCDYAMLVESPTKFFNLEYNKREDKSRLEMRLNNIYAQIDSVLNFQKMQKDLVEKLPKGKYYIGNDYVEIDKEAVRNRRKKKK